MWDNSWLETFRIPTPGVALGATRKIPGETYEQLIAARVTLVADANVANRFLSLDIFDGDDTVIARVQSTTAVTAGLTARFTFAKGIGDAFNSASGEQMLPLIDAPFPPGFEFALAVAGIQAGDQLSAITYYVRRWPSGMWEPSAGATPYRS